MLPRSVLRESAAHDRHERLARRSAERSAARRGSVRTANVPTYLYGLSDDARCSPRLLEEDEARRLQRPKAMWNKVRLNMKHLKQAQVRPDDGAGAADAAPEAAPEADPDPVTAQPALGLVIMGRLWRFTPEYVVPSTRTLLWSMRHTT